MTPEGKDNLYSERQLWQSYVRFNEAYFGNTLPLPDEISYAGRMPRTCSDAVACVSWQGALGSDYCEYRIYLLRRFFEGKDPRLLLCALLHEMVHVYLHRFAATEIEDHGPLFKEICQKLQRLGWNVDSCLNPNLCAFELRDRRAETKRSLSGFIHFLGRALHGLANRR